MIGQRLFTGRVAVAQAALTFRDKLFEQTNITAITKSVGHPKVSPCFPIFLNSKLCTKNVKRRHRGYSVLWTVETELCETLRKDTMPSLDLAEAIAVAKVSAVEMAIDHCFRLKQEVGSYALMGGTGFEQMDFLQCCKFAEGDSRILMQKMARDSFRFIRRTRPYQIV